MATNLSPRKPSDKDSDAHFQAERLARISKALGHPARVRIIRTLIERDTCIGCDFAEETGLAASTTSEHLRILKQAGLIVGEIERPRICYSLKPSAFEPLLDFLMAVKEKKSA